MRVKVTIGERVEHHDLMPGVMQTVALESPYLVSAGQTVEFGIEVEPGEHRSFADILQDAVRHGLDNPTHGTNCTCMDRLIRELRSDVRLVVPSSAVQPDWEKRVDARSRVAYILRAATRDL